MNLYAWHVYTTFFNRTFTGFFYIDLIPNLSKKTCHYYFF